MIMKLISHRGNINGIHEDKENTCDYIIEAIEKNYDVEIDVWFKSGELFLGHDSPKEKIKLFFLKTNKNKLWIHCKNIEALGYLKDEYNCFFHDSDDAVLTSKNFIWTFSGKKITNKSIAVLPEKCNYSEKELNKCVGICSDYILKYST